jgi:hypothetical protein
MIIIIKRLEDGIIPVMDVFINQHEVIVTLLYTSVIVRRRYHPEDEEEYKDYIAKVLLWMDMRMM